ncbi:SHOCT domain-containing protein [Solidesulfovibrio sp.]|uniref:SHOCT domain-containing protein n=1 Tax=Solidesulfovibrio sp. TaxID=2910990 RepID=UPI00261B720C|nr:SHOCT domain-containing protein [Solidesulfovibrio sp.]
MCDELMRTFLPMGWGGLGGPFSWLLLLLAVIVALVLVRRRTTQRSDETTHRLGAQADRDDAMRLLKVRLASGGITEEEYHRLRQAIES